MRRAHYYVNGYWEFFHLSAINSAWNYIFLRSFGNERRINTNLIEFYSRFAIAHRQLANSGSTWVCLCVALWRPIFICSIRYTRKAKAMRISQEAKEKNWAKFNEFPCQRTPYSSAFSRHQSSEFSKCIYLSSNDFYSKPFILITLCKFIYWFFPPCTYLLHFIFSSPVVRFCRCWLRATNAPTTIITSVEAACFFFLSFLLSSLDWMYKWQNNSNASKNPISRWA